VPSPGRPRPLDPREFFTRTFLTEGLRLLLTGALRRLGGEGGESVIDLQTTFGGGKTHSMLALWHLAAPGVPLTSLPGLEGVLADAKVNGLPTVTRAAIVGTALSPITPRTVDCTEIRTLWGSSPGSWAAPAASGPSPRPTDRGCRPGPTPCVHCSPPTLPWWC
jgi:predicted AAA+ superfamily ATPase